MANEGIVEIRQALISVSDKARIEEIGRALAERGVHIISTGSTAQTLRDAGVAVTDVSFYTKFPEMMDGRLKTLHPRIHGGILGRRGVDDDVMTEHGIEGIDLVVVNLYPFLKTARSGAAFKECVEQIDIGGPALLRAAAKNAESVAALADPSDYDRFLEEFRKHGGTTRGFRQECMARVFSVTSDYDAAIAARVWKEIGV